MQMDESGNFPVPMATKIMNNNGNSKRNPFIVREVDDESDFLHRELFHQAERAIHTREISLFIIAGRHGSGKTSLMLHLLRQSEVDHDRCFTASVDARLFMRPEVGIACLNGLEQRLRDRYDQSRKFSSQFERQVNREFDGEHHSGAPAHAGVGGRTYAFYLDVEELMRSQPNVPCCILAVDNMDTLNFEERQDVLKRMLAIRGWSAGKISIILVGDTTLYDEAKQHDQNLLPIQVTPWTLSEAAAYVRRKELYHHQMLVSDEQIEHLWEASDGSPRLLAHLCFELFEQQKDQLPPRFELGTEIIESAATLLTRQEEIEPLKNEQLTYHDLRTLATIVPFSGWSAEELAHYQVFQRHGSQEPGQALPTDAREEAWRHLESHFKDNLKHFWQRRILRGEEGRPMQAPERSLTTGLQRAYLRIRAAELNITSWPDLVIAFQGHIPTYEQWVEREIQWRITEQFAAQGLQPWARLRIPEKCLPTELSEWITQWGEELRGGFYDPRLNPRQVRLFEEAPGQYTHKQAVDGEHLFSDLAEHHGEVHAAILGVQCYVERQERPIVLLFGKAKDEKRDVVAMRAPITEKMRQLEGMLGLRLVSVDVQHVHIPSLEEIMRAAQRLHTSNRDLLLACFYAFISLGRRDLDRAKVDEAERWFRRAIEIEGLAKSFQAIAYQHLGMVFLARAQRETERAKRGPHLEQARKCIQQARTAQEEATKAEGGRNTAFDSVLMSTAMMDSDRVYAYALDGEANKAFVLGKQLLEEEKSAQSIIGTMGFVKLCEVEGLPADVSTSFDNEFARWMLLAASIGCTVAAAHAQQRGEAGRKPAEEALRAAAEVQPDHYMVKRALGRFYLRYGQPEQAVGCFEAAKTALAALKADHVADAPGGKASFYSKIIEMEIAFAEAERKRRGAR